MRDEFHSLKQTDRARSFVCGARWDALQVRVRVDGHGIAQLFDSLESRGLFERRLGVGAVDGVRHQSV